MSGLERYRGTWRDSPVAGKAIRPSWVGSMPDAVAAAFADSMATSLSARGFAAMPAPTDTAGVSTSIFARGNAAADYLLDPFGIRKIAGLTVRAVVVVEITHVADAPARVTASLVIGPRVADEFADAVETALSMTAADTEVMGWARAVDLPETSLGHPKTARAAGIR